MMNWIGRGRDWQDRTVQDRNPFVHVHAVFFYTGGRLLIITCCSTRFLDYLIKQQHMQNEHGVQGGVESIDL